MNNVANAGHIEDTIADVREIACSAKTRMLWGEAVGDFLIKALELVSEAGLKSGHISLKYEVREAVGDKPRRVVLIGGVQPDISVTCIVQTRLPS